MQIETYEIEEIASSEASTMAADSEAIELCQRLGLKGQLELANTETATRFPYPRMTNEQTCVFSILFPSRVEVSTYNAGIIPLRVLQVAAFCKDMPQTPYIEVWHSSNPKEDPILVGRKSAYNRETYLLARWGEALLPFEQLKMQAAPLIRLRVEKELQQLKGKVESALRCLDSYVDASIQVGEVVSFYCGGLS